MEKTIIIVEFDAINESLQAQIIRVRPAEIARYISNGAHFIDPDVLCKAYASWAVYCEQGNMDGSIQHSTLTGFMDAGFELGRHANVTNELMRIAEDPSISTLIIVTDDDALKHINQEKTVRPCGANQASSSLQAWRSVIF